eukprot:12758630-Alexandrium_andersonii.AAC.1
MATGFCPSRAAAAPVLPLRRRFAPLRVSAWWPAWSAAPRAVRPLLALWPSTGAPVSYTHLTLPTICSV